MPIFSKNGQYILLAHIPKTGGTSVTVFLLKAGWSAHLMESGSKPNSPNPALVCSPQHWHAALLDPLVDLTALTASLCVMRHPMRRLESEYFWQRHDSGLKMEFQPWLDHALQSYAENPYIYDNHLRPQTEFICKGMTVFRQEDGLEQVRRYLCHQTDLDEIGPRIPNVLAVKRPDTIPLDLSPTLRAEVRRLYQPDFDLWQSLAPTQKAST